MDAGTGRGGMAGVALAVRSAVAAPVPSGVAGGRVHGPRWALSR
ncbi:MAG: hypothetical protein OXI76_00895 [Gemmatimonadota bacterium]|nr:hypothetical protein [Gemmatimonadota bacterium]